MYIIERACQRLGRRFECFILLTSHLVERVATSLSIMTERCIIGFNNNKKLFFFH